MNFWFEMAINAVEVTLILSFLVQYFGYRMACPAKYIWTALFGVLSFGIRITSLQLLMNGVIAFQLMVASYGS